MTLYAYDGASAFDLADAKRHGAILITGYIVGHPGGMDPIDKHRVQQILALGMGFLPNWERGAAYLVSCGYQGGVDAGKEAVVALEALGVPHGTACAFSWDVWIDPAKYPACGVVADGIIAGLAGKYEFNCYAQGGLIAYLRRTNRLKLKGWLSGSTSFPGFDSASPHVGLVQLTSTPVPGTDRNVVTDPHSLGALWPDTSPYSEVDPLAGLTLDQIADAVWSYQRPLWNDSKPTAWQVINAIHHYTASDVSAADIAKAVVAALPPASSGTLTQADVEQAVVAVLTKGTEASAS